MWCCADRLNSPLEADVGVDFDLRRFEPKVASLEIAKAQLADNWRKWSIWAELQEVETTSSGTLISCSSDGLDPERMVTVALRSSTR